MRHANLLGERFSRLVVVALDRVDGRAYWQCLCDCGNTSVVITAALRRGQTRSCGCLMREVAADTGRRTGPLNKTHGKTRTRIYKNWIGMLSRCRNPEDQQYQNYGARGITVDPRWDSFDNFYADMGDKPFAGASIDRKDNDGPYSKENCRWATLQQQNNNKRTNHRVTVGGVTMTLAEAEKLTGIDRCTIRDRIKRGWPDEHIFSAPWETGIHHAQ